jgi:hypothetical protein
MNGNDTQHPGRSVDFLSRLHDGDLEPGERARFEAHRAHCSECRRAAIEFEDALSLFRSTRSTPPRSDLAARILRRVQSTNRPRAPFPLGFRLDLGWAALLLTALFALLITTPIVVRRQDSSPPLPVRLAVPTPATIATPGVAQAPVLEDRVAAAPARPAPSRREETREKEAGIGRSSPKMELESKPVEGRAAETQERPSRGVAAPAPQPASAVGEGEPITPIRAGTTIRLSIHAADDYGAAPPVVGPVRIQIPLEDRGREFLLLVDSQGTVRKVEPHGARKEPRPAASAPETSMVRAEGDTPSPLFQLRFQPGNRPRRLLVRIE